MDEPTYLGPPARRVGPSGTTEIFDGTHDDFMAADFDVRVNAKTFLGFAGAEILDRPLGDQRLGNELTDLLATRAKLRRTDDGYSGYLHLPSYYLVRRANRVDYVMILSYGEWEAGKFVLQLEGIWKVTSLGPESRQPPVDVGAPPPVRLVVEHEEPRRPWWVRGRREPRGSFRR